MKLIHARSFQCQSIPPPNFVAPTPLRILLADDNETLRAAVSGLLQGFGHRVDVASNGREAVEAAERSSYDLYLLDIQMPEMDGLEAARAIRLLFEGGRQPLIVGLSGDLENRLSCLACGMDDFFAKPVRVADLACLLGRLSREGRSLARAASA